MAPLPPCPPQPSSSAKENREKLCRMTSPGPQLKPSKPSEQNQGRSSLLILAATPFLVRDGSDAGQIDLVGLPAMCKAADPGGADFLDVAFDEGTGIDEVDRHVTAARG